MAADEEHDAEAFKEKLAHWRANGGLAVAYQGSSRANPGSSFFHESTIAERQRKVVAEAKANGWEARPVNPLYDR